MNPNITVKLFFTSLFSTLITGCTLGFSLPTNEVVHLLIYDDCQPVYKRGFQADDPLHQAIDQWLAANQENWAYGFYTRKPNIVVQGNDFSVDILKNEVTIKYCHAFFACHLWVKEETALYVEIQELSKKH